MHTSPTVAGWELVLRVRAQAESRGVKTKEIAAALDISQQYWSLISKGKGLLSEGKLIKLVDLLDFEPDEKEELVALRGIAKGRGWWSEYSALFDDELVRFYGLEAGARTIRSYEFGVIPGLLQSEDYVRALMSAITVTGRPTEAEQRVQARLHRQQRLAEPDPVQLSIVMNQAALMQEVGGPDVQRRQLLHLRELADKYAATLDLRVIPFNAQGSTAGLNASTFHLLNFESARLPTVGWLETAVYGEVAEGPKRVAELDYLHGRLTSIALSRDDSLDLIGRIAGEIE